MAQQLLQTLAQIGPFVLFLLAPMLALLIGYFGTFCRILQPQSGTLEWIALYDRAPRPLSGNRFALRKRDLPFLIGFTLLFCLCAICWIQLHADAQSSSSVLAILMVLGANLFPITAALLPCYLLLQLFFGRTALSVCGTLLVLSTASPLSGLSDWSGVLLLLALLGLSLYAFADHNGRFSAGIWALALSEIFLVSAFFCNSAALIAVIGLFLLSLWMPVQRFRRRYASDRRGQLIVTLLIVLLLAALTFFAGLAATALQNQLQFSNFITYTPLYHAVAAAAWQVLTMQPNWDSVLTLLFTNPLLYWGSLFALCAVLAAGLSRRDGRALLLAVAYLFLLPAWLICGTPAFPAAAVLLLCFVWDGCLTRGHRLMAWSYLLGTLVLTTACSILFWLLY